MTESTNSPTIIEPLRLAVLVGARGRGSNLFAIRQAILENRLAARIVLVIASRADAPALIRAREEAGLSVAVIAAPKKGEPDDIYAADLLRALQTADADTVALAGYLRRLPAALVSAFARRIVNIHPSLLPAFGGVGMFGEHVHKAVLEHGSKVSGCTVHFVDNDYDTGPIIIQKSVPVYDTDTPTDLAARILPKEHAALVETLILLAENRLRVEGRIVRVLQQKD